ncbi:hypothetical protein TrCOL_g4577 [Triparma columacea]|uniref:Aldehyde dehydrogenase n=1 Tax=Triparma columacea TaxID=722753 RepID=A0A9W7LBS1_9STRA|nr:hypothetical protein TrCOL_g4577 [Triparma columacea]
MSLNSDRSAPLIESDVDVEIAMGSQKPKGNHIGNPSKVQDIAKAHQALKNEFSLGGTRSYAWRINQLLGIIRLVEEKEGELFEAYKSDLGKSQGEWFLEKNSILGEVNHTIAHLRELMQPESRSTPLWMQPASTYIVREPLGTVLIIGPYNYPANLILCPLAAAFSAGCNAMVKPSEQMPATANFFAKYLPFYLDQTVVTLGAVPETTALLECKWDRILFTGSERVAQIIEKKVAGSLTPLCFELGGKSPTVVDSSANLTVAARRIVQGKFVNCGATCIAPDYILVESKVKAALIEKLKKQVEIFYSNDPQTSSDYGRVLNSVHLERLQGMVDDAVRSGAKVECGGTQVVEDRFMAPTILSDVRPDCAVMKEEIFGPVLPVLEVGSVDEAVDFIKSRPKPLASYIFSSKNRSIKKIRDGVSSGSMCVNDATVQVLSPDIPFGGVGPSGMGAYHGREGFLLFSHSKSVYDHDTITDGLTFMRYPPFTGFKKGILGMVLGKSW